MKDNRKPYPIRLNPASDERIQIREGLDEHFVEINNDAIHIDHIEKLAEWFTDAAKWIKSQDARK